MFTKSQNHNINYLATVTQITHLRPHPNADRLKVCTIYGNNVITGTTANEGDLVVYFPIECTISKEFLSYTNSFEDVSLNADPKKKGFFNKHGRVRAINLRGSKSEGYIIPVKELEIFTKQVLGKTIVIDGTYEGTDFDTICDHLLVKKYVPANQRTPNESIGKKSKGNVKKYASKLVDNQFQFHQDTVQLKRNIHRINPDDYISITNKLHGSNFIVSNVLVKRKLSWRDRIAKMLGVHVQETEYGNLYASRTVIKNKNFETPNSTGHYYDADIWKIASDRLFPLLREGITVTGELVGHTPSGKFIQPQYDYGTNVGEMELYVFKITYTSPSGEIYTFSHRETVEWCNKYGVKTPETFYYGKAKDLFPELDTTQHWHDNFLQKLEETYLEKKCHLCVNDVWAEGIIVRPDVPFDWLAFKLKSWNFLGYESAQLDAGVGDFEAALVEE
jgi:tRNA-binding EMAP/Myf-like protein